MTPVSPDPSSPPEPSALSPTTDRVLRGCAHWYAIIFLAILALGLGGGGFYAYWIVYDSHFNLGGQVDYGTLVFGVGLQIIGIGCLKGIHDIARER